MSTVDDHYVTREEYEQLLALARPRKRGGVVEFVCGVLMIALAVVGGYFLLVIYVDAPSAPAGATTAPPRPTIPAPLGGGGGGSGSSAPRSSLPDCATLPAGDTTTACQQSSAAPADPPTPIPSPIVEIIILQPPADFVAPATPLVYVASPADCIPRPADDPCWAQFPQEEEVTGASPDCFPLPADDPCWKQDE